MKYQNAKDAFDELKNFEGKATFKGEETVIDYFVLMPKKDTNSFDIAGFMAQHEATGSFEIEGDKDEEYTLLGINTGAQLYSNDTHYFLQLLVW